METRFSSHLLSQHSLRSKQHEALLDIRLPWYRALPLSTVEVGSLQLDGRAITAQQLRFEVNGRRFELGQMGEQVDEWWYVLDDATLRIRDCPIAAHSTHEVELTLNLYPPYMPGFQWVTRAIRMLQAP